MIGIIGAMDEEVEQIVAVMDIEREETKAQMTFKAGKLAGKDVVIVRSGIGKVNAAVCTQILVDDFGVDYVNEEAAKRYAEIADFIHLGGNTTEEKIDKLIELLRKMNDELNIPHCIKHYGEGGLPAEEGIVPEDEFLKKLPEIAANAILDACTGSNPRQPNQEEMEKLLKCCYYDTEVDF